jgi:transposase-like protein
MARAQLIIASVIVEGRSRSQVARDYGVSRYWVQQLVHRYEREGPAAYQPRSRRPHSSPHAVDAEVEDVILRLRKELSKQGLRLVSRRRGQLACALPDRSDPLGGCGGTPPPAPATAHRRGGQPSRGPGRNDRGRGAFSQTGTSRSSPVSRGRPSDADRRLSAVTLEDPPSGPRLLGVRRGPPGVRSRTTLIVLAARLPEKASCWHPHTGVCDFPTSRAY